MVVTIPDQILESVHLTEGEVKTEIAIALFQQERISMGQASILAGMPQLELQRLLASRGIPIHYGIEELEEDLRAVGFRPKP